MFFNFFSLTTESRRWRLLQPLSDRKGVVTVKLQNQCQETTPITLFVIFHKYLGLASI